MIQINLIKCSIRRDQVNLLDYGPDQLYFKQKQKITKFWPTGFFFNLRFSAFLTKKKKKEKKEIKHN